jgi:hypothetical protein
MALVFTEEMGKIKCWVTVKYAAHTWFKPIQVTGMNKYKLYTLLHVHMIHIQTKIISCNNSFSCSLFNDKVGSWTI